MPQSKRIAKVNPKNLFLIDGLGALLSAFMLGVVLVTFESTFGMPKYTLQLLSGLACLFSLYSFFCYFRMPIKWRFFMKIIGVINLQYCGFTAVLCISHYNELTALGLGYFALELVVVAFLGLVELKRAASLE